MGNFDNYIENNYTETLPIADVDYEASAVQKVKDFLYTPGEVGFFEGLKTVALESFDRLPTAMARRDEEIGEAGGFISEGEDYDPYKYNPYDARYDTPQTMVRPFGKVVDPDYEMDDAGNLTKKRRKKLTEDEWKESAHYHEELSFPNGVYEGVAEIMKREKEKEVARRELMEKAPKGAVPLVSEFIVGMGMEFTDPVNVALMAMPVVGEGKWLAKLGKNRYVQATARGAVEGFVGNIPAEAIAYSGEQMLQADYTLADSMFNTVIGTTAGAGLGVIGRGVKDVHVKYKKRYHEKEALTLKVLNDLEEDKVPVIDPYSEAQDIAKIKPEEVVEYDVDNAVVKEANKIDAEDAEGRQVQVDKALKDEGADGYKIKTDKELQAEKTAAQAKYKAAEEAKPWFDKEESDKYKLFRNGEELIDPKERADAIYEVEHTDLVQKQTAERMMVDKVVGLSEDVRINKFLIELEHVENFQYDLPQNFDRAELASKLLDVYKTDIEALSEVELDKLMGSTKLTGRYKYGGSLKNKKAGANNLKQDVATILRGIRDTEAFDKYNQAVKAKYKKLKEDLYKEIEAKQKSREDVYHNEVSTFAKEHSITLEGDARNIDHAMARYKEKVDSFEKIEIDKEKTKIGRYALAERIRKGSVPEKDVIINISDSKKKHHKDFAAVLRKKINGSTVDRLWNSGYFDFMPDPTNIATQAEKVKVWGKHLRDLRNQVWILLDKEQRNRDVDLFDAYGEIQTKKAEISKSIEEDLANKPESKTYIEDTKPITETPEELAEAVDTGEPAQITDQLAHLLQDIIYATGADEVTVGKSYTDTVKLKGITETQFKALKEEFEEIQIGRKNLKNNYNKIIDAAKDC